MRLLQIITSAFISLHRFKNRAVSLFLNGMTIFQLRGKFGLGIDTRYCQEVVMYADVKISVV